jgi:hypothetical protein
VPVAVGAAGRPLAPRAHRVSLRVTNSTLGSAYLALVCPGGSTQSLGSFGTGDKTYATVTLPTTGSYTLLVDTGGAATGSATFALTTS